MMQGVVDHSGQDFIWEGAVLGAGGTGRPKILAMSFSSGSAVQASMVFSGMLSRRCRGWARWVFGKPGGGVGVKKSQHFGDSQSQGAGGCMWAMVFIVVRQDRT